MLQRETLPISEDYCLPKGISISQIEKLFYIHYWLKYAIITNQKVDIVSLISAKFQKEVGRVRSGLHGRDVPPF